MSRTESPFEITRGNAPEALELFDWFGGHKQRITFFDDLDGGCTKDELQRKYTDGFLHKHTNKLESLGLLTEEDDSYRLTELGERIYDPFLELAEYSVFTCAIAPLLHAIEEWDAVLPRVELFKDADIIEENGLEPTKAVDAYQEEVSETAEIREIVCGVMDSQGFRGQIEDEQLTAECLYAPDILDFIASDQERRQIAKEHREMGAVHHYRLEDELPFNLSILDHTVIIWTTRVDAPGHRVLLKSDAQEVRTWAEDMFNSKKEDAEEYVFD